MNERQTDLYRRIRTFEVDLPGTAFTFAARLARENGWTRTHAERVIDEYKRFAFLAVAAGRCVCPSSDVDEAWHLHLTYTRSYWGNFCPLLGKPLHHEPTKGGPEELQKHVSMYQQTLSSYRRLFDEEPPADIWPLPGERFRIGRAHRRIDLDSHWVIPKPRWRQTGVLLATAAVGPAAATLNPFNFDGPMFLLFYGMLFPIVVLAAWWLRRWLRSGDVDSVDVSLDAYETAYLAGGRPMAIRAAMAALVGQGALSVQRTQKVVLGFLPVKREYRLVTKEPLSRPASALEETLYGAATDEGETVSKLQAAVTEQAAALGARLRREGLLLDERHASTARWWPAMLVAGLALVGAIKIAVGIGRGRPVVFLLFAVIATLAAAAFFLREASRSRAGDRLLKELRRKHAELNVAVHGATHDLPTGDVALATALFGMAPLVGGPFDDLRAALRAPTNQGGGGWTSGCGGGGCGGGGCGGGCGGCGGCGGG
ncbi:MAG TPA: TIGR04222 domain-containing membrane protein [Pirellulales bacterium]|nr:TIGR04222 domain-containing membrane protein [Pirellulales bacterium]